MTLGRQGEQDLDGQILRRRQQEVAMRPRLGLRGRTGTVMKERPRLRWIPMPWRQEYQTDIVSSLAASNETPTGRKSKWFFETSWRKQEVWFEWQPWASSPRPEKSRSRTRMRCGASSWSTRARSSRTLGTPSHLVLDREDKHRAVQRSQDRGYGQVFGYTPHGDGQVGARHGQEEHRR